MTTIPKKRMRRRWTTEEKRRIVAESFGDGGCVRTVAIRYGLHPTQIYQWRKNFGLNGEPDGNNETVAASFVPVRISSSSDTFSEGSGAPRDTAIELCIGQVTVRLGTGVAQETLDRVFLAAWRLP